MQSCAVEFEYKRHWGCVGGSPQLPHTVRAPGILPGAISAWFAQEHHGPDCRRVQASQSPARCDLSVEAENGCRRLRALPSATPGLEPPAAGTQLETASDGCFRGQRRRSRRSRAPELFSWCLVHC
ncbi:hypothetical protein NDU88_003213 [Pleurodeles waltl]|uniref:Uncharacterized protein n=1 Tax=Pleurodeles waltl TaxID=8319 RepID=A0AAV7L3C6_PLEWA|nr:hypothetical protein NDU88_003213 [Pleurodeles waltl]